MAACLILVHADPAAACHRFHIWRYPTPQRCSVEPRERPLRVVSTPDERVAVVITRPPPESAATADERTPDQIRDAAEHDAAMAKYHDYLNAQIKLLHGELQ